MNRTEANNLLAILPNVNGNIRRKMETLVRGYIDGGEIERLVEGSWIPDNDPTFHDLSVLRLKAGPKPYTISELRTKYNAKLVSEKNSGKNQYLMVNGEKAYLVVLQRTISPLELMKDYTGVNGEALGKMPVEK